MATSTNGEERCLSHHHSPTGLASGASAAAAVLNLLPAEVACTEGQPSCGRPLVNFDDRYLWRPERAEKINVGFIIPEPA
jgi:hypothetical protein